MTYADNSTSTVPLDFADWCAGQGTGQNTVSTLKRSDGHDPCYVYQRADTLTAGKAVTSITIPATTGNLGDMRIFSVGLALNGQTFPWLQWNHPADITYGTALSATQLDATAPDVAGTFAYSGNPAGTVLNVGSEQP